MQGRIVLEILGGMIWASVMLLVLWVIYKLIADFWLFDVIHEEFENLWSVLGGEVVNIVISIFTIIFLVFVGRWLLSFLGANAWQSANK